MELKRKEDSKFYKLNGKTLIKYNIYKVNEKNGIIYGISADQKVKVFDEINMEDINKYYYILKDNEAMVEHLKLLDNTINGIKQISK